MRDEPREEGRERGCGGSAGLRIFRNSCGYGGNPKRCGGQAGNGRIPKHHGAHRLPVRQRLCFLADPANWNQWAFGLGKNIRRSKNGWIADSDGGIAKVRFTPRNNFGVVDHTVIRPSSQRVYVPMRLIVNGSGCELLFTLFREPGMSDAQFASDAGFVQRDLNGLKRLLEK